MKIDTSFTVPVPPEQAWPLLLDVPRIAPCLPGASVTEQLHERRYRGRATVKVGPVQLQFGGEAEITDIDEALRTARVIAKGADTKGRGNAAADVRFALITEGTGTRVDVTTDLQLVGAVAQYGRASGLLKEIANQIVKQFAENLRQEIGRTQPDALGATSDISGVSSPRASNAAHTAPAGLSASAVLWAAIKAIVGRWFGQSGRQG